jgi:hypothetical protein
LFVTVVCAVCCKTPQQQQKERGEQERKKGKRTTIVIVVFHIMTIVGESAQKLSEVGEIFSARCGLYSTMKLSPHVIIAVAMQCIKTIVDNDSHAGKLAGSSSILIAKPNCQTKLPNRITKLNC